jgi:glycerol-3-phosphate cytidylyltransferase-like family protein
MLAPTPTKPYYAGMEKDNMGIGKTVAVSGYFNPLHVGHLRLFEEAKKLGDRLVVIRTH